MATKEEVAQSAADLRSILETSSLAERKVFIRSFVKEIKVTGDEALMTYTLPMLPDEVTEEKVPVLGIVHYGGARVSIGRTTKMFELTLDLAN